MKLIIQELGSQGGHLFVCMIVACFGGVLWFMKPELGEAVIFTALGWLGREMQDKRKKEGE